MAKRTWNRLFARKPATISPVSGLPPPPGSWTMPFKAPGFRRSFWLSLPRPVS
jgi:hypothetical protein